MYESAQSEKREPKSGADMIESCQTGGGYLILETMGKAFFSLEPPRVEQPVIKQNGADPCNLTMARKQDVSSFM
jgi:hypothetical protein